MGISEARYYLNLARLPVPYKAFSPRQNVNSVFSLIATQSEVLQREAAPGSGSGFRLARLSGFKDYVRVCQYTLRTREPLIANANCFAFHRQARPV
jgi:hypothetical protein